MTTIITPLLTEKAALGMDNGLYVFGVNARTNKKIIAAELKKAHNIDAVSVRIVNLPSKSVKFRKVSGTQAIRRKAYVQLKKGQKLPGFELPKEKDEKKAKEGVTNAKVS